MLLPRQQVSKPLRLSAFENEGCTHQMLTVCLHTAFPVRYRAVVSTLYWLALHEEACAVPLSLFADSALAGEHSDEPSAIRSEEDFWLTIAQESRCRSRAKSPFHSLAIDDVRVCVAGDHAPPRYLDSFMPAIDPGRWRYAPRKSCERKSEN